MQLIAQRAPIILLYISKTTIARAQESRTLILAYYALQHLNSEQLAVVAAVPSNQLGLDRMYRHGARLLYEWRGSWR